MNSDAQGKTKQGLCKVAVVIPIYKDFDELTKNEILVLNRIKTILSARDLFIVHPGRINVKAYLDFFSPLHVGCLKFHDKFFGDYRRGHKLGVSRDLYNRFSGYEFMLMHQTDAYVFSDQLDYWCSQGYDYIGAPWFEGYHKPIYPLKFVGVGNGGFSLRRISAFQKIAEKRSFVNLHLVLRRFRRRIDGNRDLMLRKILGINFALKMISSLTGTEDQFWGITVPKYFSWFKVAQPEKALTFSFEVLPHALYKINNNRLPFGCHAWEKYDPDFWKSFIYVEVS